jgi:hypothetical protein
MEPKPTTHGAQKEMFWIELAGYVDLEHPLVKLGVRIDWAVFEEPLGRTFDGKTVSVRRGDSGLVLTLT